MTDRSLLVNVAGASLFALVGLVVLAVSRGTPRALLVGAAATAFGMAWVFENLWRMGAFGDLARIGLRSFSALGTMASLALAGHLARPLSRHARAGVFSLGVLAATAWTVIYVIGPFQAGAYVAFVLSLPVLVGAVAASFRETEPSSRALACLGLAYAPFVAFLYMAFAASAGFDLDNVGTGVDVVFLALGFMTAIAVAPFARRRGHADRLSRVVLPATIASGLAGLLLIMAEAPDFREDYGSFGIMRAIGAFFLAVAVLKYDLLEIPLPRIAVRRGTLATGVLAALFVVAQVAQNFLSDELGLLMGGIVAGALIFAANPLQRALERLSGTGSGAGSKAGEGGVAREEAYRNTVRVAFRDRRFTRAEERHLHRLAEELGIGAGRAHEIMVEIESRTEGP